MRKLLFTASLFFYLCGFSAEIKILDQDLFPIADVEVTTAKQLIGSSNSEGIVQLPEGEYDRELFVFIHPAYHTSTMYYEELLENNFVVTLYARTGNIQPIYVTPGRVERLRNDIAISVDILDRNTIDLFQPQSAADLLGIGNKVYIQKSQMGGGSPMIRGFATNRILLVVDDVRMNTAIFRSGNVHNVISIDPFTIQETEVIFGPGSQFYGSDAIGGVLSFTTKEINLSKSDTSYFLGNATARISTVNNERSVHADFNAANRHWGSFTSITVSQFGNLQMGNRGPEFYTRPDVAIKTTRGDSIVQNPNPNIQYNTAYSQISAIQKIKFKPNKEWDFTYGLYYSNIPVNPRYDRLLQRSNNDTLRYGSWNYGPQIWIMNSLHVVHQSAYKLFDLIKLTAAHQYNVESREDRALYSDVERKRKETVNALSSTLDFEKRLKSRIRLNYGLEYIYNLIGSTGELSSLSQNEVRPTSSRYPDGSEWQSAGAYINAFKRFNSWYKLEAGLRYNWFFIQGQLDTSFFPFPVQDISNQNNGTTFSVAQLFQLSKWKLGLTASTAYRAPNIDDVSKVFDSNPGTVVIPNTDLQAEYAYNGELTIESPLSKKLKFFSALFYTYLDKAIIKSASQLNGLDSIYYDGSLSQVEQLSNTDYAEVYGVQLSLEYAIDSQWTISSAYTMLQSDSKNGEPIRHITPNFGGSHLRYHHDKISVDLGVEYQAEFSNDKFTNSELGDAFLYLKDENGLPYSPAWYTINIKGIYHMRESLVLSAALENILDKRYRSYGSGITAPGRNFSLSVSASF